jgi:hypothetical protein
MESGRSQEKTAHNENEKERKELASTPVALVIH